jgi:hypothetical protein
LNARDFFIVAWFLLTNGMRPSRIFLCPSMLSLPMLRPRSAREFPLCPPATASSQGQCEKLAAASLPLLLSSSACGIIMAIVVGIHCASTQQMTRSSPAASCCIDSPCTVVSAHAMHAGCQESFDVVCTARRRRTIRDWLQERQRLHWKGSERAEIEIGSIHGKWDPRGDTNDNDINMAPQMRSILPPIPPKKH